MQRQQQKDSVYQLKEGENTELTTRGQPITTETIVNSTYQIPTQTMNSMDGLDLDSQQQQEKRYHRKRIVQTIVDLIVIIVIFVIFALVYKLFDPKIRYMTCDESDIFFPYKPDTIPFWAVGIYATIGPILFIIGVELLNASLLPFQMNKFKLTIQARFRKFFVCTFHALSLFILGIALTLCLTEIGKRWVGRLRPHFISVCKPNFAQVACTSPAQTGVIYNAIYTGDNFCTGDKDLILDGRLSFPSGHSSYSSYCMLFLIVYVEARLILLQMRYMKPLIQLAAFAAAFVTALSRISDYHHRGTDVIGGATLGCVIALFITLVVGRVLWNYEVEKRYSDFDQKPITRQF